MKEKFCEYHWPGNISQRTIYFRENKKKIYYIKHISLEESEDAELLCTKHMTEPEKIKVCPYIKDEIFYTTWSNKTEIAHSTEDGLKNFCHDFNLIKTRLDEY